MPRRADVVIIMLADRQRGAWSQWWWGLKARTPLLQQQQLLNQHLVLWTQGAADSGQLCSAVEVPGSRSACETERRATEWLHAQAQELGCGHWLPALLLTEGLSKRLDLSAPHFPRLEWINWVVVRIKWINVDIMLGGGHFRRVNSYCYYYNYYNKNL